MALIGSDERSRYICVCEAGTDRVARRVRGVAVIATLIALAASMIAAGCVGSAQEPAAASANHETSELVLLVKGSSSVAISIQAKLRQAGYQIVADEASEHDAVVGVSEQTVQKNSLFTVRVNGQLRVSYTTHVTVSLRSEGVTLATASAEYDTEDGIDLDDLKRIVGAITEPAVMTRLAREVREQKTMAASAAKRKADEEAASKRSAENAAKRKAEREDESAWAQVVVAECTNPRDDDACEKLKDYLSKFPTGLHAAEARTALEAGTAAMVTMADERDWNSASVGVCREPRASTDCDAVKKYMNDHPTGAHVAEAREALDATRSKLGKLAEKEEREAEREAKRIDAEEKKAAFESCKDRCKEACVDWRTGGVRAPCLGRCVEMDCR